MIWINLAQNRGFCEQGGESSVPYRKCSPLLDRLYSYQLLNKEFKLGFPTLSLIDAGNERKEAG
jgi:hypothetical protein